MSILCKYIANNCKTKNLLTFLCRLNLFRQKAHPTCRVLVLQLKLLLYKANDTKFLVLLQ